MNVPRMFLELLVKIKLKECFRNIIHFNGHFNVSITKTDTFGKRSKNKNVLAGKPAWANMALTT